MMLEEKHLKRVGRNKNMHQEKLLVGGLQLQKFANGNVAMMINFSNYASEDSFGYNSKIVGKGFGMVPGGNPIYGGGSLAVSKNSKHPEDALAFIKWITMEPVASVMAALGSVSHVHQNI